MWTIGHSTHPIDRFLLLLYGQRVERLADIRHYPTSRWPQFKQDALRGALEGGGIEYVHIPELGGYRKGGYLTHVKTPEFEEGLRILEGMAGEK